MDHDSQNLDKYKNTNPVLRYLLARFLERIDACVKFTQAKNIFEAGCGEGFVIQYLSSRNPYLIFSGVDISAGAVAYAQKMNPSMHFQEGTIYQLPFPDVSFDLAMALEVLEHLERPDQALEELRRLTKEYCLISVPREPYFSLANLLGGRHIKRLGRNKEHIQFWTRSAIQRLVFQYFEIVSVETPFPWTVILGKKRSYSSL